jgi:hypothetical protein
VLRIVTLLDYPVEKLAARDQVLPRRVRDRSFVPLARGP